MFFCVSPCIYAIFVSNCGLYFFFNRLSECICDMSATWPYMASDPYFVGLTRFLSLNPPTCFNIIKTRIGWKVRKISKAQCLVSIPLTWIHTQWQICSNLYPICEVPLWSDSIGWVASSASPNQPFPSILMGTLCITSSRLTFVVTSNQSVGLFAFQFALRLVTVIFICTFEYFDR